MTLICIYFLRPQVCSGKHTPILLVSLVFCFSFFLFGNFQQHSPRYLDVYIYCHSCQIFLYKFDQNNFNSIFQKTVITSKSGERKVFRGCDHIGCLGNEISDWASETFVGGSSENFCCKDGDYCNAGDTLGGATGIIIGCTILVAGILKLIWHCFSIDCISFWNYYDNILQTIFFKWCELFFYGYLWLCFVNFKEKYTVLFLI